MSYTKHLSVLILAIGFLGLFSCTKKKDTTTTPSGTGKSFYVKLDGTVFEPAGGGRYYTVTSGGYQIVGDNAATTIEIRVTSVSVGTYTLGASASGANYASVYYSAGGNEYVSTTGELKITKSDGSKISGTFNYTAVGAAGTVQVTAGEFNDIPKM